jgi:hypothetical protein
MPIHAIDSSNEDCANVEGSLYVKQGMEARLKPAAELASSLAEKLSDGHALRRWDGEMGNYKTHLDWMYEHAKIYADPAKQGFRHYGEHSGIVYEIDDALTAAAGGDGYFRLSGELDISPELLIAQVMDARSLGEMDPTVMYMHFLHRYAEDPRSRLCLWIAAPGFPFEWRMGLDLTTWRVDADGVFWQVNRYQ